MSTNEEQTMNFALKRLDLTAASTEECDALVVLVSQSFKAGKDALSAIIASAILAGDLESRSGSLLAMYKPAGIAASRVVVVGTGAGADHETSLAVAAGVAAAKSAMVRRLAIVFADGGAPRAVRVALMSVAAASYVYTTTRSEPEPRALQEMTLGVADVTAARMLFDRAVATISGVELAKEWTNRPANHATPTMLAQAAQAISRSAKMTCEVLDKRDVAKLGMGAFMAVAQGSAEPLRFIVLDYKGGARTDAPTVLVGKGITFDSGGLSIKPAPDMDEMKNDMGGAASVLGVFRALQELKPAINVVGLIPSCENLIDGKSVKPGDVVTSMSGQTIEILNTDNEGRLILCDALTYAARFKPRAVIDIATLTGGCVIALGRLRSGMFANSDELAAQLLAAGENADDPCWRLPLDDGYADGLRTRFADVSNLAGREASPVTAAKFLQRFVGDFAWAHLDIAGSAWLSGAAKGATGRPVGLLLEYLLSLPQVTKPLAKSHKRAAV